MIRRQHELNDLCRRNTQQAQVRQKFYWYENINPNNASSEDWCIPRDMHDADYLIVDPACELNERGMRDKNDGIDVVDNCDLPLHPELIERVKLDNETLSYVEEDGECPEKTEVEKGVQPDFPSPWKHARAREEKTRSNTTRIARILS